LRAGEVGDLKLSEGVRGTFEGDEHVTFPGKTAVQAESWSSATSAAELTPYFSRNVWHFLRSHVCRRAYALLFSKRLARPPGVTGLERLEGQADLPEREDLIDLGTQPPFPNPATEKLQVGSRPGSAVNEIILGVLGRD